MREYKKFIRNSLVFSAKQIAENKRENPSDKFTAFRKIFVQEKRDWKNGGKFIGWKRGEIFEVFESIVKMDLDDFKKEWGDIGYYLAQSYDFLWEMYSFVTPINVLDSANEKFIRRANKS